MALQRPRFQIDGKLATGATGFTVPNSGGITDLVNIGGPGLVKELSYSFDGAPSGAPDFSFINLRITVDGGIIFDKNLEETERLTKSGTGSNLGDFHLDITSADDIFNLTMKDMAFKTTLVVALVNNNGSTDLVGQMEGATLWHKGV